MQANGKPSVAELALAPIIPAPLIPIAAIAIGFVLAAARQNDQDKPPFEIPHFMHDEEKKPEEPKPIEAQLKKPNRLMEIRNRCGRALEKGGDAIHQAIFNIANATPLPRRIPMPVRI